ncbi:MAG: hydroxymethylglutaryl-CoA reductase, degradative [Chloroflexi bacterium]|nr:hydroxymethylglutaryl-CoA reductase, degradative [Chloroflexota bacterium]MBS60300.1 hydroxymethylglutaryl-CoA reductase, degradative [Anaerolineaceae bacterium]HCU79572.1 hydroxymethylglutaryl-CoA reductase, degradative [Chloroflexota bacterium]|tara:strand:+ start:818 stop:2098 length:1281 start_codon:yes stop_codon:yes gene_type:complete
MNSPKNVSRLPDFYNLEVLKRHQVLLAKSTLELEQISALAGDDGLNVENANHMIENVIGVHGLPIGIATNFIVNGHERLVPMVIEESSVVAGASLAAKLARAGGGFKAKSNSPEMIGQIQILDLEDLDVSYHNLMQNKQTIIDSVMGIDPVISELGGGVRDMEIRLMEESPIGPFIVVHLIYDTRDAMGANAVNTATEYLTPIIEEVTGGRVHLRILSNLADRRLASASVAIPLEELGFGNYSAEQVRDGIIEAWAFASVDPYRAATHNKGIMNGVDAVVIATGNDWRAIEAGAHAYAARSGSYTSLSKWYVDSNGSLCGEIEMPMAVGVVGGATRVHPSSQAALELLDVQSSSELAETIVSVGLAQNLAALRALSTEGIQRGHMGLHARQVAIAAGAEGNEVNLIASKMVSENDVRIDRALELLR